jgi:predicted transcriptional regulator
MEMAMLLSLIKRMVTILKENLNWNLIERYICSLPKKSGWTLQLLACITNEGISAVGNYSKILELTKGNNYFFEKRKKKPNIGC